MAVGRPHAADAWNSRSPRSGWPSLNPGVAAVSIVCGIESMELGDTGSDGTGESS